MQNPPQRPQRCLHRTSTSNAGLESDFSFVVKTPAATAKLDPGSKAAYDKWEEGLMMCISAASPLASR